MINHTFLMVIGLNVIMTAHLRGIPGQSAE